MIFVDDVVLIGESRDELNGMLKTWRQILKESRDVEVRLSICNVISAKDEVVRPSRWKLEIITYKLHSLNILGSFFQQKILGS